MKYLQFLAAALLIGFAAPPLAAQEADYRTDLGMLLNELSATSDLASNCESALHEIGKDALGTETCGRFVERYERLWGDRETLKRSVLTFARLIQNGHMPCDPRCQDMLRRSEDLRVSITYVLDYMDFMRTL